jgi:hypothetical protein
LGSGGRPARRKPLGRKLRRFPHERRDALPSHTPASKVREQVGVRIRRDSGALEPVEVRHDLLREIGAHLHFANAGLGLGVGNPEVGAVCGVQA